MKINKVLSIGILAQIVSMGAQLLIVPIYHNTFGPVGFGLIGFSIALAGFVQIADMGFPVSTNKELSQSSEDVKYLASIVSTIELTYIIIASFIFFSLLLFNEWIVGKMISNNDLEISKIMIIIYMCISVNLVVNHYINDLHALQKSDVVFLAKITYVILFNGTLLYLVWMKLIDINLYFIINLILSTIHLVCLRFYVLKSLDFNYKIGNFSKKIFIKLFKNAYKIFGTTILGVLIWQIDKLIIINYVDISMYGHYIYATTYGIAISLIASTIMNIYTPIHNKFNVEENKKAQIKLIIENCLIISLVSAPGVIIFFIFTEEILSLILTDEMLLYDVVKLSPWFVVAAFLNSLGLPFFVQHIAANLVKQAVMVFATQFMITLFITYWMILNYGVDGAKHAVLLSSLLFVILLTVSSAYLHFGKKSIFKAIAIIFIYILSVVTIILIISILWNPIGILKLLIFCLMAYILSFISFRVIKYKTFVH